MVVTLPEVADVEAGDRVGGGGGPVWACMADDAVDHASEVLSWLERGSEAVRDGGEFNVNAKDELGFTVLHRACEHGRADAVAVLLRCDAHTCGRLRGRGPHDAALRAVRVNTTDEGCSLPLHDAVRGGFSDVVSMLVKVGHAKVELKDGDGYTALEVATDPHGNRSVEIVLLLVSRVESVRPRALHHLMVRRGDQARGVALARILVNAGADPQARPPEQMRTCLMDAGITGNWGMISYLLDEVGVDPNETTMYHETALMFVTMFAPRLERGECTHVQATKKLLEHGANVDATDIFGRSALFHCCMMPRQDLLKLLLDAGAKMDPTSDGAHPVLPMLSIAVSAGLAATVQTLCDYGADANEVDREDWPPVVRACCEDTGRVDVLQVLLDNGANPNAETPTGFTALHGCACHGFVEAAGLLIDRGASIAAPQPNSFSPLLWAAREGSISMVRFLVEKGAPLTLSHDFDVGRECPNHHPLVDLEAEPGSRICNLCGKSFNDEVYVFSHCAECDYDTCKGCQSDCHSTEISALEFARTNGHKEIEQLLRFAEENPIANMLKEAGMWRLLFKVRDMGIETAADAKGATLQDFTATLSFTAQEAKALLDLFNDNNDNNDDNVNGNDNNPRPPPDGDGHGAAKRSSLLKRISRRFQK